MTRKQPTVEISSQLVEVMDEEQETGQEQRALVAEAFADDDVLEEFQAEKTALEEAEKPKDIDLTLPGWGSWGGHGIKPKQKKFIIKAPERPPRKDKFKPGVIISEKEDTTIKKFQVSQPPFPFSSVEEFEASIRQPIGKEWNPETTLRSLTEPKVLTKAGSIIYPMDKALTFTDTEKNAENDED